LKHKRPKPNKQKAARIARGEKQALESLAEKRRPFEPLLKEIVASVLHANGPTAPRDARQSATWLEVGAGLGQLRALLPSEVHEHMLHTDVSEWLVRGLLDKYPQARALAADVTRMPFDTESVEAVLGLCVFDSFPDAAGASREIRRVLRNGGRFVHFLDAATNIEPLLGKLVAAGQLPLPNFLADVTLSRPDLVETAYVEHLTRPYHDVLSVSFSQINAIRQMLNQAGHRMAAMLDRYMAVFSKQPFEALPAARSFVELTSDPEVGRPLNQALTSLFTTLQSPPYSEHLPFELQSHSSLAHFKATLEHYFGPDFGYRLRFSGIVYARAYEADTSAPLRARVRRVGIGQNSVDWPSPQGVPTHTLNPTLPSADATGLSAQTHVLREAAIYCLVSEKSEPMHDART
jgi:SAM-dependent methyltransferase